MSDGNNYQGQAPTRDRHAIGDFALHLQADPQPGGTKSPRLSVYYHANKVTIEVRTNVQTDMDGKDRGIIRAELDPHIFFMFLDAMDKVVDGPAGERPERLKIKRPDFRKTNGGEPVMDAMLAFGKEPDGTVYISVLSYNKERPAIKFYFTPDRFYELVKGDGSPWSRGEASMVMAKGYLKLWSKLIPHYMITRYKPKEFNKSPNNGNNGGGYNRQQGGGYQNNQGNQNNQSGGDMRTEQKSGGDAWGGIDDLPF